MRSWWREVVVCAGVGVVLATGASCQNEGDVPVDDVGRISEGKARGIPESLNPCGRDLRNDPHNCGSCGNSCSNASGIATCREGVCGIECDPGFGDCDGVADNGCEVDFAANPTDCGGCGVTCSADATCTGADADWACVCEYGFLGDGLTCEDCWSYPGSLVALALSPPVALTPAFSPCVTTYEARVLAPVDHIAITAAALDPTATIRVDGNAMASGDTSAPVPLGTGVNNVPIDVTVDSGSQSYTALVTRPEQLSQVAYVKASNTEERDQFGWSLAVSGTLLAVGANHEDSGTTGIGGDQTNNDRIDSGAVYLFRRTDTGWTQEAYVKASNTGGHAPSPTQGADMFGNSVALDGDTLVVGALGEDSDATGVNGPQDNNAAIDSGAAYVFRRDTSGWTQEAYLKPSNTKGSGYPEYGGQYFGKAVALDGDTIAVGAYGEGSSAVGVDGDQSDNSFHRSGAVYVFRRTGTTWAQEAYIKASNTDADDMFGASVALDGDTLVVGAYSEGSGAAGIDGDQSDNSLFRAGAVYVFRRSGTAWAQEAYVKSSNPEAEAFFGADVEIAGDTLAVSARGEASGGGGVYVFTRTGATWSQQAWLLPAGAGAGDRVGSSLALIDDLLVVGASGEATDTGATYLFSRAAGTWTEVDRVVASNPDFGDLFGYSVALSGEELVIGAVGEKSLAVGIDGDQADNSFRDCGAVYILE